MINNNTEDRIRTSRAAHRRLPQVRFSRRDPALQRPASKTGDGFPPDLPSGRTGGHRGTVRWCSKSKWKRPGFSQTEISRKEWYHAQYGGWGAFRLTRSTLATAAHDRVLLCPIQKLSNTPECPTPGMVVSMGLRCGQSPDPTFFTC